MKAILAIATSLQVLSCFGCHDCRTDPEATSRHVSPEKPAGPTGPDDSGRSRKVSVVYCTDLFHPHNDPDDHFDIATLYSIPEIDIRAIILDQNNRCGWDQEKTPGSVPVSQLNYITRRDVPFAAGLRHNLTTPEDSGTWQEDQKGVELLLEALRQSPRPVTVITVGSLRDVAAAYNREPTLLRERIDRLFVFAGEASQEGFVDYNVDLDINAYIRIMGSDLPVYWVPCFDGGLWKNNGHASWWDASHSDLLSKASKKALNFFIYALQQEDRAAVDPIRYIDGDVDTNAREKIFAMTRHLWCSSVFAYVANRKIIRRNGAFASVPANTDCSQTEIINVFTFRNIAIEVDRPARPVTDARTGRRREVRIFHITRKDIYAAAMTAITAELLSHLGENGP